MHHKFDRGLQQVSVSFARLLKLNKPELPVAILGCLAAAVLGAQMPAFSIALSSIIGVFYEPVSSRMQDRAGQHLRASTSLC